MSSTKIFQITAIGLRSNYWSSLRIRNSIPITNVRTAAAAAGGKGGKKGAGQSVGKAKRVRIKMLEFFKDCQLIRQWYSLASFPAA